MFKRILTLSLAIAIGSSSLLAQPGTLDPTFSTDGIVTTAFGDADDIALGIAKQTDGKIVVVGGSAVALVGDFVVARYNTDGSLDNTFSGDGRLTTTVGTGHDEAHAVVIQADGKIVVAGISEGINFGDFAVVRYNTNGSIDNTFSTDGIATIDIGTVEEANAVAVQPDGKIVVAGGSSFGGFGDFMVVRYNPDGTLDNTFNANGILTLDLGNPYERAHSVAIQSDGKIVMAGGSAVGGFDGDFAVARYNTDGTPDSSFSADGLLLSSIIGVDEAYSVALQPNGKIVATGKAHAVGNTIDFGLARFNTDGSMDNTFSSDGKLSTDIGGEEDLANSIVIQADGKIVVAGASNNGANDDFALVRYNADGSLDNGFSTDGIMTTAIGSAGDVAYALVLQADGKMVAAGRSNNGTNDDIALVRYNTDGTLDNSFSTDGLMTTDMGTYDEANAVGLHWNGDIAVAGGSDGQFAVARYNTDGTLDNVFSLDGRATTDIAGGNDVAYSLVAQIDDKILAAGVSDNGLTTSFALVRYNGFGNLDNSFSTDGIVTTSIGTSAGAYSVALQSDGKIVAAGFSTNVTDDDFAVVRYSTGGNPDITFSTDGMQTTDLGTNMDQARSVAIQSDGKIVAAGVSGNDFAVVRYAADGSLDNSFSTDGMLTTSIGTNAIARSVTLQPDGKIVVAGSSDGDIAVARYNTDGSLDNTFSTDGMVTTSIGSSDAAYSVLVENGRIVVAGVSDGDFAVVRYKTDGALDNNFSSDGILITSIGTSATAHAAALQGDWKIVVAGVSNNGTDDDFTVTRIAGVGVGVIDFTLSDNSVLFYPNPVSHTAALEYTLTADEMISIKLLDMQGKTLKTFVDGQQQSAGDHQQIITMPGSLASGSYLIVIQSASGRVSVQVVK